MCFLIVFPPKQSFRSVLYVVCILVNQYQDVFIDKDFKALLEISLDLSWHLPNTMNVNLNVLLNNSGSFIISKRFLNIYLNIVCSLLLLLLLLLRLFPHYTLVKAGRWKISRLNYQVANHFNQALDVFHNELQWKSLKCQLALEGPGADGRAPFGLTQAAGLLKEQPGTCQQPGCLATLLIPSARTMCIRRLYENAKIYIYIVLWTGGWFFVEIRKSRVVWIITVYVYAITNKHEILLCLFSSIHPFTHNWFNMEKDNQSTHCKK